MVAPEGRSAKAKLRSEQRSLLDEWKECEARVGLLEQQIEQAQERIASERARVDELRERLREIGREQRAAAGAQAETPVEPEQRDYVAVEADGRVFSGHHFSTHEDPRGSRTAIIGRLAEASGGPLALSELLEAAAPHVGSENSARMLVSRMAGQGDIVRVKKGVYRLPLLGEVPARRSRDAGA